MTNQPTQAHIQEFGLQPYQYGDQTVWIMPNTQPATWAEVSGFNEVLHFAVFHSMPERVWLQWASGEPGSALGLAVLAMLVLVSASLGLFAGFKRWQAARIKAADPVVALAPLPRSKKAGARGATPRRRGFFHALKGGARHG
ncbi:MULTISPECIES: hypothetical protein [Halomonas]|uniref:hypothetical protein n=1 Tax=Halomonas TaxID=2745 RepID=UPI003CE95634